MTPDTFIAYVGWAGDFLEKAEGDIARAFELACLELVFARRAASSGLLARPYRLDAAMPPEIVFPAPDADNR